MRKLKEHIGLGLMVVGYAAVAVGLLMEIWMGYSAAPGHALAATQLGVSITFSGLVVAIVGTALWF